MATRLIDNVHGLRIITDQSETVRKSLVKTFCVRGTHLNFEHLKAYENKNKYSN